MDKVIPAPSNTKIEEYNFFLYRGKYSSHGKEGFVQITCNNDLDEYDIIIPEGALKAIVKAVESGVKSARVFGWHDRRHKGGEYTYDAED